MMNPLEYVTSKDKLNELINTIAEVHIYLNASLRNSEFRILLTTEEQELLQQELDALKLLDTVLERRRTIYRDIDVSDIDAEGSLETTDIDGLPVTLRYGAVSVWRTKNGLQDVSPSPIPSVGKLYKGEKYRFDVVTEEYMHSARRYALYSEDDVCGRYDSLNEAMEKAESVYALLNDDNDKVACVEIHEHYYRTRAGKTHYDRVIYQKPTRNYLQRAGYFEHRPKSLTAQKNRTEEKI